MVMLMKSKIRAQHLKSTGLALAAGVVASGASYVASKPVPVYENNQLIHVAGFAAHDNGWPLPYYHYACFPFPSPACSQYLDWWALAFNIGVWTVVAALAWFTFRQVLKRGFRKR